MDLASGLLSGFQAYRGMQINGANAESLTGPRDEPTSLALVHIEPLAISSQQQNALSDFFTAYKANLLDYASKGGSIDLDNRGSFKNMYDIAGCPTCARSWTQLNQHRLANSTSALKILASRGKVFAAENPLSVSRTSSAYLTFKFNMTSDIGGNGEASYCLAVLTGEGFVVDTSQCTDSDGNPIPTSANNIANNRYMFQTLSNLEGFLAAAKRFGIPISGLPTPIATVDPIRVDCGPTKCEAESAPR